MNENETDIVIQFSTIPKQLSVKDVILYRKFMKGDNNLYNYFKENIIEKYGILCRRKHAIKVVKENGNEWENDFFFKEVVSRVEKKFNMEVIDTRFNFYELGSHKHFHHDDAALRPNVRQNITVVVSFGQDQKIRFKRGKDILDINVGNNTLYAFSRDVNVVYQHAVLHNTNEGRISIVVWGYVKNMDYSNSNISTEELLNSNDLNL